jgi:tetratricopeptide (TPR) repeat protein
MAIEDIERLKEKIDRDPDSKLFVPLAEEYKKAGMFDEAIEVLAAGLERQPTYLSARVSLGKIYMEKGLLSEAKAEFDKVITVIPDNLYAHKRLAEIYRDLGEKEAAINEFKTVLKLNPMDEWATASISAIEGEPAHQEPPIEEAEEISVGGETPLETEENQAEIITARDMELSEILSGEEAEEAKEEEISRETALSKEDKELWKTHLETVKGKDENKDLLETPSVGEETEEAGASMEAEELPEEDSFSFEDIFKEPEAATERETRAAEREIPKQPVSQQGIYDADQYILQGKYSEAMDSYRTILSGDPADKHVLQRVEELKAFLKLLGKDKEQLVLKLERFLEGIKKRQDEFSGST